MYPKHDNPQRLSITELEYRHAGDNDKECLVFLVKERVRVAPLPSRTRTLNQGKGGKLIKQLRKELSEKQASGLLQDSRQLANQVAAAVEKWRTEDRSSHSTMKQGRLAPLRS